MGNERFIRSSENVPKFVLIATTKLFLRRTGPPEPVENNVGSGSVMKRSTKADAISRRAAWRTRPNPSGPLDR